MTTVGQEIYLIGGSAHEAIKEISLAKFEFNKIVWNKVNWTSPPFINIQGRQAHSTVHYKNSIYIFGGSFSYNKERGIRECTNNILEFNVATQTLCPLKTDGAAVNVRKNHTAVAYKCSMVVFGGMFENGII
jgi:hypothetical protein